MYSKNKNKEEIALEPMEITSPRTAEQPGPVIEEAGCCDRCSVEPGKSNSSPGSDHSHNATYLFTLLSLVVLISGLALDYFGARWFTGLIRFAWFGLAYGLVGAKVIGYAVKNIAKGNVFNEFFLMSLATLGAFYIGEYAEGVAVMLFYVIGEHFQEAAVLRSRRSIKALIDNRPSSVSVLRNGLFTEVSPEKVGLGETIQVKAGEKVALDGELLSANSSFNTAALTGESRPDTRHKGEAILAGMVNLDKVVELKVTATYANSALSRILQLVEEASGRKARTQQFITRFAKRYTPVVVYLAIALTLLPYFFVEEYVFNEWLYRALVFLVISCPCALVVSIPLGYFGGIGAASKNGILFKGSNYLDLMRKVDAVVMDKTGTLTEGVFEVQKVFAVNTKEEELLQVAAALESKSTHPVAQAIVAYAGPAYQSMTVENVEEIPGHGLKGEVNGRKVLAGNYRLFEKYGIVYDADINEKVETLVLVAIDQQFAGYIAIADQVKTDAKAAVTALRTLGVNRLVMLSGDKQSIVQKVAKDLELDEAYGELLPQDKMARLEEIKQKNKTVAFVGDGLNDAPVIALADVGIAMGALGSDAAIETADVVIQTDQPSKIATAIQIAKSTNRIVWQNIGLAFGVKVFVLLLGAGGIASMWEAVFADVGVAFIAILNAIRIQKMKF